MTEPAEGSSGGVSWIDVAASAVGIEASMRAIGERASTALVGSMRAGLAARGAALGDELLAGLDKTSQASMVGASIGEAIGRGIGAPLKLVREAFSGLGRDGTASAQALTREYNNVSDAFRRGEASLKALNTEAKRATEAGGAFDSTQILRVTTSVDELRQRQSDLAAQIRASDEAAKSAGSSFNISGLAAGVMGGAISAGAIIGIESFDELISKATELGEKLLDAGEIQEGINRRLQTTTAATGEQLESLSQTVNRVAGNTAAGFDVITDATAALSTRLHLTGAPLDELVQKVSNASVILGQPIDVNAFTAALHALGVSGADAGTELDTFFKISRATGTPLNELITDLGQNASVLSAFGLNADQSARLLASLSEAGIKSSTVIRGLNPLVKEAEKAHESFGDRLKEVVGHMEDAHNSWLKLHDQADLDTENFWASKLGPRAAIAFKQAIDDGTLSVQSLNGALGDLPAGGIDDVADSTRTLSDELTLIEHQVDSALGPLGETISEALKPAFEAVSAWIKTHGAEILSWIKAVGDGFIDIGGQVATLAGDLVSAAGGIESLWGSINNDDKTKAAGQHLQDLGAEMARAAGHANDLKKAWDDLNDNAIADATLSQNLDGALRAGPNGPQLTDDQSARDTLRQGGVDLTPGPGGQVSISVDSDANRERVEQFLKSKKWDIPVTVVPKTPDAPPPPPLPATPPAPSSGPLIRPGSPLDWWSRNMGPAPAPTEPPPNLIQRPGQKPLLTEDSPVPTPHWLKDIFNWFTDAPKPTASPTGPSLGDRFHPSGDATDTGIPTNLTVQPAAVKLSLGDVLDAAGLPSSVADPSKGVVLNTAMQVKTNAALDVDTTMTSAGIDTSLQGALPDSSGDGVLLPTAFDTSKPGPRMSVGDLMESVGIPEANQGDSGVTFDVSYNTTTGAPGTVPAGYSGGPGTGGQVGAPASSAKSDVARAIHDAVLAAGYSEQTADYSVAASDYESSLSPDITNASGHHGLFQESSDKPSNGAQQQIQWFISELQRQGGPAAVNAYPGGPGNFIADKIEVGGYPGSNYDQFLGQVPGLISGGQPPLAAPGGGGGDGTYGNDLATDTATTASPQFGGIPGQPSGTGQPVLSYMKSIMDQFNQQTGSHLSITADFPGGPHGHPQDSGDHPVKHALDIAGNQQEMDEFVEMIANSPALLSVTRQLIHDDPSNPGIGNLNAIGGHLTSGAATYGSDFPKHVDHDHWAVQAIPNLAGATAPATNVQPADYQTGGLGIPTVMDVSRITTDPGNPQVAAPTAPGSSYQQVAPPPGMEPAPPGAANTVNVPGYGNYQFSWDLPPDEQAKLRPEEKERRDTWIQKAQDLLDRQQNTAQQIQELQQAVTDAQAKADDVNALPDDPSDPDAKVRANKELAETQRRLTDALHQQSREETQSRIDAEKPPPYEKDSKGSGTNDQDAADLGKGLVKGVFQEFGIDGSVFKGMKAPNEWGLTKILGGVLSFGLNLSAAKHDSSGGSAGGSSDSDGGVLGMIEDAIPALKKLLHPGTADGGQPSTPAPDAAALPAPPAPADAPQEPLPAPASAPSVPAVPAPAAPAPASPAPPAPAPAPAAPPPARAPIDVKGYQFGSPDRPAPPSPAPNQVVTPGLGGAPALPGFPTPPPGATPAQIQGAKPPAPGPAPALTPPTAVPIPGPKAGSPVAPVLGVPAQPAGYRAHHAVPGTLEVGKNWLPGGLDPGLKLPTAAQQIDGADAAFAGIITSAARVATTLASPQGILQPDMTPPDPSKYGNGGGAPDQADVTPQIGSTPPPTIPAAYTGPQTTTVNPLTVNNTYQGFNPTPAIRDQISGIAATTSAPAMAGGAGIPL